MLTGVASRFYVANFDGRSSNLGLSGRLCTKTPVANYHGSQQQQPAQMGNSARGDTEDDYARFRPAKIFRHERTIQLLPSHARPRLAAFQTDIFGPRGHHGPTSRRLRALHLATQNK